MEFTSKTIEIYPKDTAKTTHICVVKDARVASQLNRILRTYPLDTRFKKGEEPRFVFNERQMKQIRSEVPIMGRILAQVNK
jgi:hypothetical protein